MRATVTPIKRSSKCQDGSGCRNTATVILTIAEFSRNLCASHAAMLATTFR